MNALKRIAVYLVLCSLASFLQSQAIAQNNAAASGTSAQPSATKPDGQRDFDFELGSWKIHLKRLLKPLTGSNTWVEFDGTSVTRKVWDGRANLEEFKTSGPTGPVEGLTLRLYNPESRQWSIYWANRNNGLIGVPTIGEFKNGRGEFFDQEPFNGRTILVRYIWSEITPNSAHFEQSFSDDGGKTWEVNWITDQTRVSDTSAPDGSGAVPEAAKAGPTNAKGRDGQRDFDFHIGTWKTHVKRLVNPMTGGSKWAEYDGTTRVRKGWNGDANLVELNAAGAAGELELLSLRLYNPQSRQWSLHSASSKGGTLSPPTIGEFKNGRGEFYSQETLNGRAIFVRFVISKITPDTWRFEQAFSDDGGKTWETNWIATDTRVKDESDKAK